MYEQTIKGWMKKVFKLHGKKRKTTGTISNNLNEIIQKDVKQNENTFVSSEMNLFGLFMPFIRLNSPLIVCFAFFSTYSVISKIWNKF